MSLINQMLKDIDKRQAGKGASYSIDQGIRTAPIAGSRSVFPIALLLVLLAVAAATYFFWDRISAGKPSVTPLPIAGQAAPPPQVVVVVPAPANTAAAPTIASEALVSNPGAVAQQAPSASIAQAPLVEKQKSELPVKPPAKGATSSRPAQMDSEKPGQVLKAPTVEQQSVNLLRKAETQVRAGQLKDAQATLDQALGVYPSNQDARVLLSRIQLQEGQLDTAIATLKQGLSDRGNAPEYHATLGQLLQRKEQHDDAISQYVLALKRSPNNAQWLVGLAISLQAKGQSNAAAEAYQQALDIGSLPPGLANFAEQRLRQMSR